MPRHTPLLSAYALLLALAPAAAQDTKEVTATSPDKKLLARADNAAITVADVATGKLLMKMQGHNGKVTVLAYSQDGKLLASGSADKSFAVWDAKDGRQILKRGLNGVVSTLRFSPDNRVIIVRDAADGRREFDINTGREVTPKK